MQKQYKISFSTLIYPNMSCGVEGVTSIRETFVVPSSDTFAVRRYCTYQKDRPTNAVVENLLEILIFGLALFASFSLCPSPLLSTAQFCQRRHPEGWALRSSRGSSPHRSRPGPSHGDAEGPPGSVATKTAHPGHLAGRTRRRRRGGDVQKHVKELLG